MGHRLIATTYLAWPLACLAIALAGLAQFEPVHRGSLLGIASLCALATLGLLLLGWKLGGAQRTLNGLLLLHGIVLASIWFVVPHDDSDATLAVLVLMLLVVVTWLARRTVPLPSPSIDFDSRHAPADIALLALPILMAANLDGGAQAQALAGEYSNSLLVYVFYAWLQLSLFLVLPIRVMRQMGVPAGPASLVCAAVFALVHMPNVMLMTATGLAMWLFSWQYQKGRNLLVLVLLMAVSATSLKIAVPVDVSGDMRIGADCLDYMDADRATAE